MSLTVRPQREDFFPKLRRGHGTKNEKGWRDKETGAVIKQATACVDETCILNQPKSHNLHEDAEANLRDWCDDHRLSVYSKERRHAQYDTPMAALYGATGGR